MDVGEYLPGNTTRNAGQSLGLKNMTGGISEWCSDIIESRRIVKGMGGAGTYDSQIGVDHIENLHEDDEEPYFAGFRLARSANFKLKSGK